MVLHLRDTYRHIQATLINTKGLKMEASDSNLVVTRMIRAGEVSLSELERLLDSLEGQQLITTAEHEALLELAWKINTENPSLP